jgi:hypothetical protein
MLDDPEFQAAVARAQKEIQERLKSELCPHGYPKYDERGYPSPCAECRAAADQRASGFWHNAKSYMDGVKPVEEVMGPKNTSFIDTPGFEVPEKKPSP